jgi:hypothetical protein
MTTECDPDSVAWAAGLYDAEGSCSAYLPRHRKTYRRQIAVSQGGDPGKAPVVLIQFRNVVGGAGNITGPYNGYLFYWKSTRIDVIDAVATQLWPYLSQEKRDQFIVATRLSGKPLISPAATSAASSSTELAWAGGLFDGEGNVSVSGVGTRPSYPQPAMEVPQSSDHGIPTTLLRFRETVGCGSITGPRPPRNPWGRLPSYRWELGGHRNVEMLCGLLWPWLGATKRSHIEWALSVVHAGLVRGAHKGANDKEA